MIHNFTAEIIQDNEINQFVGIVPGLPGAHSQAATLDELYNNLQDVIRLCLIEITEEEKAELPKFVGTQNISVAV
jgi:predicted RNase H-like HicB family nuclease